MTRGRQVEAEGRTEQDGGGTGRRRERRHETGMAGTRGWRPCAHTVPADLRAAERHFGVQESSASRSAC